MLMYSVSVVAYIICLERMPGAASGNWVMFGTQVARAIRRATAGGGATTMHGLCRQEFGDTCCRSVVTNVSTMFVRHLGGSFAAPVHCQEVAVGPSVGGTGSWNPGWLVGLVGNSGTGHQLASPQDIVLQRSHLKLAAPRSLGNGLTRRKAAQPGGADIDDRLATQHQPHLIWRLT